MTNFTIVSLIPIEFLFKKFSSIFISNFQKDFSLTEPKKNIKAIFKECLDSKTTIYEIKPSSNYQIYLALNGSSICFAVLSEINSEKMNDIDLINELKKRKLYHKSIINFEENSPLFFIKEKILQTMFAYKPKINYAFSFYVFKKNNKISKNNIKILLEPSLLGLDDMLCSNHQASDIDFDLIDFSNLKLNDIDLFCYSNTYISWATIVAIVDQKHFSSTLNLLIALETRLQIIWNKCYSTNLYIDEVIENRIQFRNIDELFWNSSKILAEARSIISSTLSSRGNIFFNEMIKTSNLEGEIFKLEKKIALLDKYVSDNRDKTNLKYQKSIEILLLVTALASLIQIFYGTVQKSVSNLQFGFHFLNFLGTKFCQI